MGGGADRGVSGPAVPQLRGPILGLESCSSVFIRIAGPLTVMCVPSRSVFPGAENKGLILGP